MKPWLLAIRPQTLPASVSPVLLANSYCYGHLPAQFQWLVAALTLVAALWIQIAVNLANDYFDCKQGVDTAERLGPVRVTQAGLIAPGQVLFGMVASIAMAVAAASYLIAIGGWPILWLTITAVLCVLWYSAGPWSLASLGLGEITVFVFFGLAAVLGTQWLQLGQLNADGLILGCQMGLISAAILLVNNLRDRATDQAAGKLTLALRIGERLSRRLYALLLIAPFVLQSFLMFQRKLLWLALVFLTLPLALGLILQSWHGDASSANNNSSCAVLASKGFSALPSPCRLCLIRPSASGRVKNTRASPSKLR